MKLSFIGWLLAGATVLSAQPRIDWSQLYEIQGRVLDADTGTAIPRAKVTLSVSSMADGVSQRLAPVMFLADSAGAFRVANVPAGAATLSCEHPGYLSVATPPHASSAALGLYGSKDGPAPVTLYLRHQAVIRGTALDEQGSGLGGAVQAYRLTIVNGRRVPQQAGSADVDVDGTFRIAGLKPGQYYVAFSPSPLRMQVLNRACRRTIFPASRDRSGARIITLTWGDEQEIDFRPALEPANEVVVKSPPGVVNFSVAVRPAPASGLPDPPPLIFSPWNEPDGAVRITGLPAGEFVLNGSWFEGGVLRRGSKKINVSGGNVGQVTLERSSTNVLVITESGDIPASPSRQTFIRLESGSLDFDAVFENSGTVRFGDVPPGVYSLFTRENIAGHIQSAYQGGRDALREGVVVPQDGPPEALEVTFKSHSGTFEPTLDPACAKGEAGLVTVAFLRRTPLGLHLEGRTYIRYPKESASFRIFSNRPQRFTQPPGDYVVLAWNGLSDIAHIPYNEPEFLEQYGSLIEHTTLGESGSPTVIIHHLLPASVFDLQ